MKFFVSCITPERSIGVVQFEAASEDDMKSQAEKLAPCPCEFRAYVLEEFDADLPVGEFVSAAKAKELGY